MKNIASMLGICLSSCLAALAQTGETVTFQTSDGVEIVADYYPPVLDASPVVILLHMYRADRSSWKPLVPALQKAGFAILAIDMRGHGDSVRPASLNLAQRVRNRDEALFNNMYRDVEAGYAFLAQRPKLDMSRLALVGASVGCSVALNYAARDRSVDVVVCLTPGEKYLGVDSVRDIQRYGHRPILLLAAEGERAASDRLGKLNTSATVGIVGPGRIHGTRMFGTVSGIEDRIVSFLHDHIGSGVGKPVVASIDGDHYFTFGSKGHIAIPKEKVRLFSTAAEARARGLSGPDVP